MMKFVFDLHTTLMLVFLFALEVEFLFTILNAIEDTLDKITICYLGRGKGLHRGRIETLVSHGLASYGSLNGISFSMSTMSALTD